MNEKESKTAFIQAVEAVAKQMASDVKPEDNKALVIIGIEKAKENTQTVAAIKGKDEQILTALVGLFSIPQMRDVAVRALSIAALKEAFNTK